MARKTWTTAEVRAADLVAGDVFLHHDAIGDRTWREVLDVWTEPEEFDSDGWSHERLREVSRFLDTEGRAYAVVRYLDEQRSVEDHGQTQDGIVGLRLCTLVTVQVPEKENST